MVGPNVLVAAVAFLPSVAIAGNLRYVVGYLDHLNQPRHVSENTYVRDDKIELIFLNMLTWSDQRYSAYPVAHGIKVWNVEPCIFKTVYCQPTQPTRKSHLSPTPFTTMVNLQTCYMAFVLLPTLAMAGVLRYIVGFMDLAGNPRHMYQNSYIRDDKIEEVFLNMLTWSDQQFSAYPTAHGLKVWNVHPVDYENTDAVFAAMKRIVKNHIP
ncbi:hypothetical protein ANO11243_080740 [Dothideomycetidae sp. 11243]|nr:hypothetical protein ANO11243_080740 [fungal sp. No.11243]